MKTLNFYHQKRCDGGIRTGVEVNGERVLELFESGTGEVNSALEWFVDVRCRGRDLPTNPEAIRGWLLEKSDEIGRHLAAMATELVAGIDQQWPLTSNVPNGSGNAEIKIVCSGIRRLTARDIRRVLLNLKNSWKKLVESLPGAPAELAA